jgi:hypothetical protein
MNHAARVLSRRRDMADLLVGVTGDFVPPREVLRPGYLVRLLFPPLNGRQRSGASDLRSAIGESADPLTADR